MTRLIDYTTKYAWIPTEHMHSRSDSTWLECMYERSVFFSLSLSLCITALATIMCNEILQKTILGCYTVGDRLTLQRRAPGALTGPSHSAGRGGARGFVCLYYITIYLYIFIYYLLYTLTNKCIRYHFMTFLK